MKPTLIVLLALLGASAPDAYADEPLAAPQPRLQRFGTERVRAFGGPDSVNRALHRQGTEKESFFRLHVMERALRPVYAFKERLSTRHGLTLGTDYNALYQGATASLGEDEAAGGVFRLYGHWTALGRGTPTTTEILFRLENRHRLGSAVAPENFGTEIGSLLKTANSFADWGWGITNLQWQQWFEDGRVGFALGQVDLRDWVDTFDLSNWRTALLGAAVTYPVNPLVSPGLGAAWFSYFRKYNTPYVIAGIGDANGKAYEFGFDSFFRQKEYYSFVELGWTPSFDSKNDKNVRLTYWHQDARKEAGKPEGWGLSFSAAWKFQKRWAPFLRGGYAEGGLIASKTALVAGLGLHRRSHDLLGVALGWARPYDTALRDQFTLELFYRLQISQHIGITPDVELILDPSNNPGEDWIAVFSLRTQIAL